MKRQLLVALMLACLPTGFAGTASLSASIHNSDDSVSVSLSGENFDFSGTALLEPSSLLYKNGGKSTDPECSYDYGLSFNGKPLASGATTDSGSFSWHAEAASNYIGDGQRSFKLSAQNTVQDGEMSSYYANSDHRAEEDVEVDGAKYAEAIKLSNDEMAAKGGGSSVDEEFFYSFEQTLDEESIGASGEVGSGAAAWTMGIEPVEKGSTDVESALATTNFVENGGLKSSCHNPDLHAQEAVEIESAAYLQKQKITSKSVEVSGNGATITSEDSSSSSSEGTDTKGLKHLLHVSGSDDWSEINAGIAGDIVAQWKSSVSSEESAHSLSLNVEGYGTTSEMDEFKMIGTAKGFPTQVLPAGNIDISFSYPYQDDKFKESLKLFYEETKKFFDEYDVEMSPALYYYLNQETYINPYEISPDPNAALLPEDYYNMNMAFKQKV